MRGEYPKEMDGFLEKHSTMISTSFILLMSVITIVLMVYGKSVFLPAIIALVIWFLINDITENIQRFTVAGYHMPRKVAMSIGLILLAFFAIRITRIFYVASWGLVDQAPVYYQNLGALLDRIPDSFWATIAAMFPTSNEAQFTSDIERTFGLTTNYFATYISAVAVNVPYIISQSGLILIYVIFLLLEQNTFAAKLDNMFPDPRRRSEVETILASIKQQIQKFVSVKSFLSLLTGVVSFGVMWVFGLDFAIVWAILIFLLYFIPYIGPIIAVTFPILTAALQFGELSPVLGLLTALVVIHMVVGYVIEPWLMGGSLGISPFVVLISLAIFGTIWGITGMFLSVPLVIILIIVLSHFDSTRAVAILLSGDGRVYGVAEDETLEQDSIQ